MTSEVESGYLNSDHNQFTPFSDLITMTIVMFLDKGIYHTIARACNTAKIIGEVVVYRQQHPGSLPKLAYKVLIPGIHPAVKMFSSYIMFAMLNTEESYWIPTLC